MAVYVGGDKCREIYVARNGQQVLVSSVWVGDKKVFPDEQVPPGFILRVGVSSGNAYTPLREWAVSIGKTYQTITKITVPVEVVGPSLYSLFNGCNALTGVPDMDTSNVTNMGSLFYNCWALTSVPALNTIKVTNMNSMFYNCRALTSVPALNTIKVTNPVSMFDGCSSLESVTLPGMGTGFTTAQDLDMLDTKLGAAAANALMQSLGTVPAAATDSALQLPATAAGANTSLATAKNWEVTIG